ncbi:FAD-binding oxidoreductase [Ramlibacter sp. G-1-2-2]|uniref:Delta(24)-sterol reductase n=1 Tax=Ramlibacter agri TaxID=2728837 RepID=A0A848HCT3_9BURK|nr:FAD-binding oxidoreductase [Ramlibacter agri]NML48274.1 FAD-binding oxidoreductase [Ramlibacter agri]
MRAIASEAEGCMDVEGCCSFDALVAWALPRGVMPAVVPPLKKVTVGGAIAGVGVAATSFRQGLVHHAMRELEVRLPGGEVVTCTPDNAHRDLFFGFPNSHGCLGQAQRVRLATLPVRPFVHVRHGHYRDPQAFLAALARVCANDADFVDGMAFGTGEYVLSAARFADDVPWRSSYGVEPAYWQSLRERDEDYLATGDWLWRWDTDWSWYSRQFGAQRSLLRRVLGRWRGQHRESVVQDVDIPLARAGEFLGFLQRALGTAPIWVCPVHGDRPGDRFPLYSLAQPLYVSFGFRDVPQVREPQEAGGFDRLVEEEARRLGGIKALHAGSHFTPGEFDGAYGGGAYRALKARYDPQGRAPELYDKCVARA